MGYVISPERDNPAHTQNKKVSYSYNLVIVIKWKTSKNKEHLIPHIEVDHKQICWQKK